MKKHMNKIENHLSAKEIDTYNGKSDTEENWSYIKVN